MRVRPLGSGYCGKWIQNPISAAPPSVYHGVYDCGQEPSPGRNFSRRNFNPPSKGGNWESRRQRTAQWVLLQIFSYSKKRWQPASHLRPQATKYLCKGSAVQDAVHQTDLGVHRERGVVHFPRSGGRIFPRPNLPRPQAISALRFSRRSLSVQGPPIRPFSIAEGVHQGGGSCATPASNVRPEDPPVSGRLAYLRPKSQAGGAGHTKGHRPCTSSGFQGEFEKEQSRSCTAHNVCGSMFEFPHNVSFSHPSESFKTHGYGGAVSSGQTPGNGSIPEVAWHDFSSSGGASLGSPQGTPTTKVVEHLRSPSRTRRARETQSDTVVRTSTAPLEEQVLPDYRGSAWEHPVSQDSSVHGCLPNRLGCRLGRQDGAGCVDSSLEWRAHQCVGVKSGPLGPGGASPLHQRQTCPSKDRQLLHCVPYKSSGEHQVSPRSPGGQGAVAVGLPPASVPQGNIYPREGECGSRPPVQDRPPPRRVEAASRGCSSAVVPIRQSSNGSVCIGRDDSVRELVLTRGSGGALEHRCSVSRVANRLVVRFPPAASDPPCSPQGCYGTLQGSVDSSQVAGETLVSCSPPVSPWPTMASAGQGGPSLPGTWSDLAPQTGNLAVVGVATSQPLPQELDEAVMHTIRSAKAPSTQASYSQKWKVFSSWCRNRQLDPATCPVQDSLRFLQSLFDAGRVSSTIKVYAAAISSFHEAVDGASLGRHRLVSEFIKGTYRLRPGRVLRAPSWDLTLVLRSLTQAPYEPMEQADLKSLSHKMLFLLAICSAKRVSELHALSVSEQCVRWKADDTGVSLWPNPAFLPKVVNFQTVNQVIEISSFQPEQASAMGNIGLQTLCPVRVLRAYMARTQSLRHSHSQLFVCYGGNKLGFPVSKQRLSHWVVDTISHAYNGRDPSVRP